METEHCKIFVGGVSQETCEETLENHFKKYGEIKKCQVMRYKFSGASRGFGFITFAHPSSLNKALRDQHIICGRTVDVQRAKPKGLKFEDPYGEKGNKGRQGDAKKIFVGGLPSELREEEFKSYFEIFGSVSEAVILYDEDKKRARGFGFVTFESEEVASKVLRHEFHSLQDKRVQVKKAEPKQPKRAYNYRNGWDGWGFGAAYNNHFAQYYYALWATYGQLSCYETYCCYPQYYYWK